MSLQKLNIAANQEKVNLVGPMPLHYQVENLHSVFIDGGINYKGSLSIPSSESLGDNDSNLKNEALDFEFPSEKDQSDFAIALQSLDNNVQEIFLHGLWGGRQDHFLMIIGEIFQTLEKRSLKIHLYGPKQIIHFERSGLRKFNHHGTFSMLSMVSQTVRVTGAKYSGNINLKPLTSYGLSNESEVSFAIEHSLPLGVFILLDDKIK